MAEHVDNADLFGSGGHVWAWQGRDVTAKQFGAVGTSGAGRIVTHVGARACRIQGADGGPAILKAVADSRQSADEALDGLEEAIEELIRGGRSCRWGDDSGRSGDDLVVAAYRRIGPRRYGHAGGPWTVWQDYIAELVELKGTAAG